MKEDEMKDTTITVMSIAGIIMCIFAVSALCIKLVIVIANVFSVGNLVLITIAGAGLLLWAFQYANNNPPQHIVEKLKESE
ncbi:MAG: hypothetical protein KAS32_05340 [Candidatus Peribacteraceae bacterium]|nr:hypothetical protein [Candidatus Peribacteraceae bacterium]